MKTEKKASKQIVVSSVSSEVPAVTPPDAAPPPPQPATEPVVLASQDPGPAAPTGDVVPKTPTEWKPTKLGRGKGARGKREQFTNAAPAGKEFESSTTYVKDFGENAPPQARVAHLLTGASAWRGQWVASKRWSGYTAEQNAAWWEEALAIAELLQPTFEYAASRDPSVAKRYPAATQFMQALSAIAKRGAKTRKAAAEQKKAAGGSTPPATTPTK